MPNNNFKICCNVNQNASDVVVTLNYLDEIRKEYIVDREKWKWVTSTEILIDLLNENKPTRIVVNIDSGGGDLFLAISHKNIIQRYASDNDCTVVANVLGICASAATVILFSAPRENRFIGEGAFIVIHNPQGGVYGQASEVSSYLTALEKVTEDLADIYVANTFLSKDSVVSAMNIETWYSAGDSITNGFCGKFLVGTSIAANYSISFNSLSMFNNIPKEVLQKAGYSQYIERLAFDTAKFINSSNIMDEKDFELLRADVEKLQVTVEQLATDLSGYAAAIADVNVFAEKLSADASTNNGAIVDRVSLLENSVSQMVANLSALTQEIVNKPVGKQIPEGIYYE